MLRSGFVANDVKSQWVPVQSGKLLGYVLNLHAGTFQVPQRRVNAFHHVLRDFIAHKFVVSARTAARFTAYISTSYKLLLGTSPFQLSADAQGEVVFWEKNFRNAGYPIWSPSPKPEVLTYSDASDSGWGRFTVQVGGQLAVGSWSIDESNKSSTFWELQATGLVLKSLAPLLRGKEVLHRIDNKNTEIILSMGSRKPNLHNEAVNIYRLCTEFNIRLAVEWISRDLNGVADELSWTISLILPVLITWTNVWVLTQSTGLQVYRLSSWKGFVADSSTLVVRLFMPSLSHGQGITIGCFLHHTWFLMFCATCQVEERMEPS